MNRKFVVDVVASVSARIPIGADSEDEAKQMAIEAFKLNALIRTLIVSDYIDMFDYDIHDIGEV